MWLPILVPAFLTVIMGSFLTSLILGCFTSKGWRRSGRSYISRLLWDSDLANLCLKSLESGERCHKCLKAVLSIPDPLIWTRSPSHLCPLPPSFPSQASQSLCAPGTVWAPRLECPGCRQESEPVSVARDLRPHCQPQPLVIFVGWLSHRPSFPHHWSVTSQMEDPVCGKEETMTYRNIWFLNSR